MSSLLPGLAASFSLPVMPVCRWGSLCLFCGAYQPGKASSVRRRWLSLVQATFPSYVPAFARQSRGARNAALVSPRLP